MVCNEYLAEDGLLKRDRYKTGEAAKGDKEFDLSHIPGIAVTL